MDEDGSATRVFEALGSVCGIGAKEERVGC